MSSVSTIRNKNKSDCIPSQLYFHIHLSSKTSPLQSNYCTITSHIRLDIYPLFIISKNVFKKDLTVYSMQRVASKFKPFFKTPRFHRFALRYLSRFLKLLINKIVDCKLIASPRIFMSLFSENWNIVLSQNSLLFSPRLYYVIILNASRSEYLMYRKPVLPSQSRENV